jgi:glycosyltransferase involved in cell wall biosynthesis
MRNGQNVAVIIPALNEARAIGKVLAAIPAWVDQVIVADNGSTDATADIAREGGAQVVSQPRRGYGAACLAGMAALGPAKVVVFLDGDYSDHPEQMPRLVDPVTQGRAQLVIGSRILGHRQPGALTPQARWGNWLACLLIRLFWGVRFSDLGPFRAVERGALERMGMADLNYGWTVEMQIKAARLGLVCSEAPVDYRRRLGLSHISGTFRGAMAAGGKILLTIAKYALAGPGS